MRLIEARGLGVKLGGVTVLSGVDLAIQRSEIVTIVGPNGSGKTTLLRALLGAVQPSSGMVSWAPQLKMGYAPQKLMIDRTLPMTVRRFLDLPRRAAAGEASEALSDAGATDLADRQLSALSGGQTQRALLARAVLGRPDVLLLDEPTQGLDQPGSAAFYLMIERLRDTLGCAVVMVSHELHVVMSASDRVICLNGHVCCEGAPAAVASAPEYRALFGAGTKGALALYRHEHDHSHDGHSHTHAHNGTAPDA